LPTGGGGKKRGTPTPKPASPVKAVVPKKPKGKAARSWDRDGGSKETAEDLDRSGAGDLDSADVSELRRTYVDEVRL
jgi:hypothetical protein